MHVVLVAHEMPRVVHMVGAHVAIHFLNLN